MGGVADQVPSNEIKFVLKLSNEHTESQFSHIARQQAVSRSEPHVQRADVTTSLAPAKRHLDDNKVTANGQDRSPVKVDSNGEIVVESSSSSQSIRMSPLDVPLVPGRERAYGASLLEKLLGK